MRTENPMQYQLLPSLSEQEYEDLKADIEARGVMVPIEKDEQGNILDGFHRSQICAQLGITDFPVTIRAGMTHEEKIDHALTLNLSRRHLNTEQRRELVLKLRVEQHWSAPRIAEKLGVSVGIVHSDMETGFQSENLSDKAPDRSIGKDGKSYPAKRAPKTITARNVKEEQKAVAALSLIGWDKADGETQTAGEIILEAKQAQREVMHSAKREQPLPAGRFQVIYADPPWRYENSGFNESADAQYPTMALDDICALPIHQLTTDTSVLFLWATNPLLLEAIKVLESWGFEYKTNIAWVKDAGRGKGWFLKSKHELLLIGVKPDTPHPAERPDSAFEAARGTVHSRKPVRAYEIIEAMYPGSKVELFARVARNGWSLWGNESALTIDMETGELLEASA